MTKVINIEPATWFTHEGDPYVRCLYMVRDKGYFQKLGENDVVVLNLRSGVIFGLPKDTEVEDL